MTPLAEMRRVFVLGVGMSRYRFPSEDSYVAMGLEAVRAALSDADVPWTAVEAATIGTTGIGIAAGRVMLRYLGPTGLPVMQLENASASGSFAFAQACLEIASGRRELVLAAGVDKHGDQIRASSKDPVGKLSASADIPLIGFALLMRRRMRELGVSPEDTAAVAVKNHNNAAKNPYAQFQKTRTLEDVLSSRKVVGDLTALQCTPRGDGAAAAILCSADFLRAHGLDPARAVRVLSSTSASEPALKPGENDSQVVAERVARACLAEADLAATDLDIVELHDAFSIEEILYTESFGLCPPGQGHHYLGDGRSMIGGDCAINPSGGLLGQGHPLGPTGIGQIHEIVQQLRGESGDRQHPGAKVGMAHMIGLGTVAIAHVLHHG